MTWRKISPSFLKLIPIALLGVFTVALFAYLLFLNYYRGKIFPGIYIAGYSAGGQTPYTVRTKLESQFKERADQELRFNYEDQNFSINPKDASPSLDLNSAVDWAYTRGRSTNYLEDFKVQLQGLIFNLKTEPKLTFGRPTSLIYQVGSINQVIKQEPQNAKLALGENIIITPAENGQELDSRKLLESIEEYLNLTSNIPDSLPLKTTAPKFATTDAQTYAQALENVGKNPIKIHHDQDNLIVDQVVFLNLLDLSGNQNSQDLGTKNIKASQVKIDPVKLTNYLQKMVSKINQDARDARFVFDPDTKRVTEFQSAQEGRAVDIEQTASLLSQAATLNSSGEIPLPVKVTKPTVATTDANNFGIKDLIGQGVSYFSGSIDNRIYNIGLAASRINGVLVAPGEVFSFNKTVGEISGATGYKPAYVIKSGRTVLDDGGGVCQVSTTVFRAALNSGLPITERTAHAYRVSYYEQGSPPGIDATVFSPSVDFKFKNDTSSYILVQAYTTGTSLTIDIYGSSDGRVASVSKPVILNQTPPPPELRQDDPALPRGTIKQVDWAAWGANVTFNRTVTRNGETLISEAWKSNYRPWQAVYLVGTKD